MSAKGTYFDINKKHTVKSLASYCVTCLLLVYVNVDLLQNLSRYIVYMYFVFFY